MNLLSTCLNCLKFANFFENLSLIRPNLNLSYSQPYLSLTKILLPLFQTFFLTRSFKNIEIKNTSIINWLPWASVLVQKITLAFTLRGNCLYAEFLWSVFSRIRTEYGEIRSYFYTTLNWVELLDKNGRGKLNNNSSRF